MSALNVDSVYTLEALQKLDTKTTVVRHKAFPAAELAAWRVYDEKVTGIDKKGYTRDIWSQNRLFSLGGLRVAMSPAHLQNGPIDNRPGDV